MESSARVRGAIRLAGRAKASIESQMSVGIINYTKHEKRTSIVNKTTSYLLPYVTSAPSS